MSLLGLHKRHKYLHCAKQLTYLVTSQLLCHKAALKEAVLLSISHQIGNPF